MAWIRHPYLDNLSVDKEKRMPRKYSICELHRAGTCRGSQMIMFPWKEP